MIHLFGIATSVEQALGEESDNIFVLRAQNSMNNPEIETVYAVDDSAPIDRS